MVRLEAFMGSHQTLVPVTLVGGADKEQPKPLAATDCEDAVYAVIDCTCVNDLFDKLRNMFCC